MAIFNQLAPMKSVPHRVATKIWEDHEDDSFRYDLSIILSILHGENSMKLNTSVLEREKEPSFKKAVKILTKGGFVKVRKDTIHKTSLLEIYYHEAQQERDSDMFGWSAVDAYTNF